MGGWLTQGTTRGRGGEGGTIHLHGPHCGPAPKRRGHLAGGEARGPSVRIALVGRQQVGHSEVCDEDAQGVQATNQDIGSSQVPVQDAQGVKVQQPCNNLLEDGQDLGQGQTVLGYSRSHGRSERGWGVGGGWGRGGGFEE